MNCGGLALLRFSNGMIVAITMVWEAMKMAAAMLPESDLDAAWAS
jgi:hypothetical protein